ncbi:ATP-binding protein, partial [Candidatus Woesearchaeota archaeon]|nr:ATP-binding protein [Candidatus Woesearchaeota archaeon]
SFRGKKYENKELYREELLREFTGYLCCSGFPEMAGKSPDVVKKYIKELVIEKIIYKDIPAIFHVEEPAILESLYSMILEDPGEIVEIDSVANDLTISRQTASLYLSYLEQSFLIKKLYNYSRNARKTQRKLKKYYPTILSPALVEKSDKFGKVFEAAMVIQLQSDFFWRDTYKNEVDAIKVVDGQVIPVEIKVKDVEVKPLLVFMRKFKIKEGIVLTYEAKGTITKGGFKIEVVPFYEYFLP